MTKKMVIKFVMKELWFGREARSKKQEAREKRKEERSFTENHMVSIVSFIKASLYQT